MWSGWIRGVQAITRWLAARSAPCWWRTSVKVNIIYYIYLLFLYQSVFDCIFVVPPRPAHWQQQHFLWRDRNLQETRCSESQQSTLLQLCYTELGNNSIGCSLLSSLQPLTIFQRSLTTMQIQIQGLLQFAVPLFPTAEVSHTLRHSSSTLLSWWWHCTSSLSSSCVQRDLLGIQQLLNSSEASLHQLTALLDCRGLNKVGSIGGQGLGHILTLAHACTLTHTFLFFFLAFWDTCRLIFGNVHLTVCEQETTCFFGVVWLVCCHLLYLMTLTPEAAKNQSPHSNKIFHVWTFFWCFHLLCDCTEDQIAFCVVWFTFVVVVFEFFPPSDLPNFDNEAELLAWMCVCMWANSCSTNLWTLCPL